MSKPGLAEEEEALKPADEIAEAASSLESLPALPLPPDGGYGWVVCGSAFLCMVLLDGILFSFGVFFLELLDYFQESKARTATVGSVLMGMSLLGGPLVSVMVNLWGIRAVSMVGAVVASCSIGLSLLAPNITMLTVMYGFCGGFGISMVYLPAILAVGFYFEKRRALANGITMSGSGIGTFIYGPLCNYLQQTYTWKGAVLILSGITLHCLVLGALFRPLRQQSRRHRSTTASSGESSSGSNSSKLVGVMENFSQDDHKILLKKTLTAHLMPLNSDQKAQSYTNICGHDSIINSQGIKNSPSSGSAQPSILLPGGDTLSASTGYLPDSAGRKRPPRHISPSPGQPSHARGNPTPWMTTLYRKDLLYSGSFTRIPDYKKDDPKSSLYSLSALHADSVEKVPADESNKRWRDVVDTIRQMTGLSLLKNPNFLICMFAMVLWTTHSTILNFLPDYCVSHGYPPEKAAFLISIIGVSNTLARVLAGWLSDFPRVDVLWVNMSALFLGGVTCFTIPFTKQYILIAAEATVFGICMGTWTSLRPIILVELLGLDNLTNAFGLLAMFQGLAFTLGPPIAGSLFDYSQSYFPLFCIAGTAFLLSGVLCLPMRPIARFHARRQLKYRDTVT